VLLCGEETPLQHSDGLGLWLVTWVVRSSGGDLTLDDADPRGSRVTLRLPTADCDG
jgi:signal transduction histidine kinase